MWLRCRIDGEVEVCDTKVWLCFLTLKRTILLRVYWFTRIDNKWFG